MGNFLIENPDTIHKLMSNIKVMIDKDLLLDESVCNEQSLRLFFSAEDVTSLGGNDMCFQLYKFNLAGLDGSSIRMGHATRQGKRMAYLNLYQRSVGNIVTFELVAEIYGTDWRDDIEAIQLRALQTNRVFGKAQHPMGNRPIIYSGGESKKECVHVEFDEAGSLQALYYEKEI